MKSLLHLLCLLFFVTACDSFNKAKSTDAEGSDNDTIQVLVNSSAIPEEYSSVDTIPVADSLAAIEPEEPKDPLEYMTIEEKSMIDEINLLRADPQAYTQYIDGYIQNVMNDPAKDNEAKRKVMTNAGKLIVELQTIEPLPALLPNYKLYQVAKLHGKDMASTNKIGSIGSDGSHPFHRIRDGAQLDGAENLLEGYSSVRESILALLIEVDEAKIGKHHLLFDPDWTFVTCHEAGAIGNIKNVWIQLFGVFVEEEETDIEVEQIDQPIFKNKGVPVAPPVVLKNKPAVDYSFLVPEEKEMIDDINLLRSNPAGYIKYVEIYAQKYKEQYSSEDEDFNKAVKELKEELISLEPLSQLQPHEKLYNVAKTHGLDNKSNNRFEHIGSDKSDPFDRVKRSGLKNYIDENGFFSPNENLVGGEDSPRESIVALLIDSGVSSRGHRRALLQPNWKYAACYKIGVIENLLELRGQEKDDMNNCWIQLFAKD